MGEGFTERKPEETVMRLKERLAASSAGERRNTRQQFYRCRRSHPPRRRDTTRVGGGNNTSVETKQSETQSAEEGLGWEQEAGRRPEERHGFDLTEPCDQER